MEEDLKLKGYSSSTRRIYLLYAREFAKFYMRSPAEMSEVEIRQYQLHLIEERKASHLTLRQVRAALRFLYSVTLRRPTEVDNLAVPRQPVRLVQVLSGTEVEALLAAGRQSKIPRHPHGHVWRGSADFRSLPVAAGGYRLQAHVDVGPGR
jgi:site-specific recombinase XerD